MIRPFSIAMLAPALALVSWAEPVRHPIAVERIAAVISGTGMQVRPEQVKLLSDVVASTADPELKVRSIEMQDTGRTTVRLECGGGECVPFLVTVRLNGRAAASAQQEVGASTQTVNGPNRHEPLVRRGAAATLLLSHGPVHISIPVTCLDNGASGQSIRAVAAGTHQVYTAQVVSADVLSGRF